MQDRVGRGRRAPVGDRNDLDASRESRNGQVARRTGKDDWRKGRAGRLGGVRDRPFHGDPAAREERMARLQRAAERRRERKLKRKEKEKLKSLTDPNRFRHEQGLVARPGDDYDDEQSDFPGQQQKGPLLAKSLATFSPVIRVPQHT